jgi:hypothetical protein
VLPLLQGLYRSTPQAKSNKTFLRPFSASLRFFEASSLAQIPIGIKRYETAFNMVQNHRAAMVRPERDPIAAISTIVSRFNRRFWSMAAFDGVLKIAA